MSRWTTGTVEANTTEELEKLRTPYKTKEIAVSGGFNPIQPSAGSGATAQSAPLRYLKTIKAMMLKLGGKTVNPKYFL